MNAHYASAPLNLVQPPLISFGLGCLEALKQRLVDRGAKRVSLLASHSASIHIGPFVDGLRRAGVSVEIFSSVPPEPTVNDFEKILNEVRVFRPDAVVGCGGGSVLDVAKLVAALHDRPESVRTYFGIGLLPGRRTYLVCAPTTAGTGSEVSPNAILLDEEERLKKGVISPWLVPDAAFIDPAFTLTVPPAVTAATGIDALVHCIEGYANRFSHPMIDLYALQGIRLIGSNLLRAVQQGHDLEARTAVAMGSLYGGLCLGPVNTAAVHALAYPLGSEFRLAHGLSNALLLVSVLRFTLPSSPQRYAEIALALGVERGANHLATAERGLAFLESLIQACGVPRGLSACGISADSIPQLAAASMKVTRLLKNNLREVTASDAESIYREAFSL
jgi:alcohol dehydrogenase class IV